MRPIRSFSAAALVGVLALCGCALQTLPSDAENAGILAAEQYLSEAMSCIDSELAQDDEAAAVLASIEPCADQELVGVTQDQIVNTFRPDSEGSWATGIESVGDGVFKVSMFTFAEGRAVAGAWSDHLKVIVCWALQVSASGQTDYEDIPCDSAVLDVLGKAKVMTLQELHDAAEKLDPASVVPPTYTPSP